MPLDHPVLLLPGVMGSRLYFPAADKFWDPDSTRRMLGWMPVWLVRSDDDNRREMHVARPAGVLVDPLGDDPSRVEALRGWAGVVWDAYGPLLRELQAAADPQQVYAAGYDWRQTLRWLGRYMRDRIHRVLQAAGADRLSVVTHSMGGLVLRAAFRADPDLRDRVARVVHVCQPSAGAVVLYRRLFTGMVRPFDGGGGVSDRAFRAILGGTRQAFLGNMSGLPGPLQLLPTHHLTPAANGQHWNPMLGSPPWEYGFGTGGPPAIGARLAADVTRDLSARLAEVNRDHAWLDSPTNPAYAHPDTWLLYGTGVPTETRVEFPGGVPTPGVTADGGDGTVPAASATALGLPADRVAAFAGLVHADACKEPAVRAAVRAILAG